MVVKNPADRQRRGAVSAHILRCPALNFATAGAFLSSNVTVPASQLPPPHVGDRLPWLPRAAAIEVEQDVAARALEGAAMPAIADGGVAASAVAVAALGVAQAGLVRSRRQNADHGPATAGA